MQSKQGKNVRLWVVYLYVCLFWFVVSGGVAYLQSQRGERGEKWSEVSREQLNGTKAEVMRDKWTHYITHTRLPCRHRSDKDGQNTSGMKWGKILPCIYCVKRT